MVRVQEEHRQVWAEELLDRMTPVMSALGIIFLLVVLGEQFAREGSAVAQALTVAGWLLWLAFVLEYAARLAVAPDRVRFLRRSWWQLAFLVLPFLRFLRLARALRMLRTGRVFSSALRSTRSARRILGGRLGWLGAMTVITVLAGSQLLYAFADFTTYGDALHAAALATIGGEPVGSEDGATRLVEVGLVTYSVVVFATLAGSLGAYFLSPRSATHG